MNEFGVAGAFILGVTIGITVGAVIVMTIVANEINIPV